jgi:hypothetical protein
MQKEGEKDPVTFEPPIDKDSIAYDAKRVAQIRDFIPQNSLGSG